MARCRTSTNNSLVAHPPPSDTLSNESHLLLLRRYSGYYFPSLIQSATLSATA